METLSGGVQLINGQYKTKSFLNFEDSYCRDFFLLFS